jgi:hypothetical protein
MLEPVFEVLYRTEVFRRETCQVLSHGGIDKQHTPTDPIIAAHERNY